ncbi:MAG: O-antigen ligase family protein, partial [Verrucomicrobiae bacterium]|nr:O-antigen ligase family protein [Verrucomicrobiae bacterium]
ALWVVLQTFQVAVFVIVVGLTFVFTIYGLAQWRGRRVWLWLPLWVGVLIAALWARDTFLYPNKKIFHGVGETLSSGASSNAHIQTRLNGIRWAIRKSSERPWFGFGPGRDILRRVDPANFDVPDDGAIDFTKHTPIGHLHNQYADLLVRVGWVGLVLYLAFLATVLIGAAKEKLWRASWTANAGSAWRACAATALAFALVRFCAETYPASSVGIQYWLLIAFAALPASAWTDRWRISESTREPPRSPVLDPPA